MATMTAARDDSCPYEWAEYNLPQELWPTSKSISPFARRFLNAAHTQETPGAVGPSGVPARTRSNLDALLLPGLGLPLPKL